MQNSYGKSSGGSKPAPKGYHYMPDGTLMKDSDHKGKPPKASGKPSSAALDAMMRKLDGGK